MKSLIQITTILLIYFFTVNNAFALDTILRIPEPRSKFDISHDYHKQLLILALSKAAKGKDIPAIKTTIQMSQGRAMNELVKGERLDVYWFGANQTINENLIPIKVPTSRGLIGYRNFTIRKDSVDAFDKVKTIDDLRKFVACQGIHWPDTKILNESKLKVTTTTIYENLFKMLNAKRCDYFPRSYHDANTELQLRKHLYPDLMSYKKIILHYPFAIYFFTHKSNERLTHWLEEGMNQLAEDGEIEHLMKKHPLTSSIYPLKNEKDTVFITIPNPLLSSDTDVNNSALWILSKDFNLTEPLR
jgi:hypothetical protein